MRFKHQLHFKTPYLNLNSYITKSSSTFLPTVGTDPEVLVPTLRKEVRLQRPFFPAWLSFGTRLLDGQLPWSFVSEANGKRNK
jgi:hypothetical protein